MQFKLRGLDLENLFPYTEGMKFDLSNYNFKGMSNNEIFEQMKTAYERLQINTENIKINNFEKNEKITELEDRKNIENKLMEKINLFNNLKERNENLEKSLIDLNQKIAQLLQQTIPVELQTANPKQELSKIERSEFLTPLKEDLKNHNPQYEIFMSQFKFEPSPSPMKSACSSKITNKEDSVIKSPFHELSPDFDDMVKIDDTREELNESFSPKKEEILIHETPEVKPKRVKVDKKKKKKKKLGEVNDNSNRFLRKKSRNVNQGVKRRYRGFLDKFKEEFKSGLDSLRKKKKVLGRRLSQKPKKLSEKDEQETLRKTVRSRQSFKNHVKIETSMTINNLKVDFPKSKMVYKFKPSYHRNSSISNMRNSLNKKQKFVKKHKQNSQKVKEYLGINHRNQSLGRRKSRDINLKTKNKSNSRPEFLKKNSLQFVSPVREKRVAFGSSVKKEDKKMNEVLLMSSYKGDSTFKKVKGLRRSVQPKKSKGSVTGTKRRNSFFGYGERNIKIRGLVV